MGFREAEYQGQERTSDHSVPGDIAFMSLGNLRQMLL